MRLAQRLTPFLGFLAILVSGFPVNAQVITAGAGFMDHMGDRGPFGAAGMAGPLGSVSFLHGAVSLHGLDETARTRGFSVEVGSRRIRPLVKLRRLSGPDDWRRSDRIVGVRILPRRRAGATRIDPYVSIGSKGVRRSSPDTDFAQRRPWFESGVQLRSRSIPIGASLRVEQGGTQYENHRISVEVTWNR